MNNQKQTYVQMPKKKLVSKSFIIVLCLVILMPVGLVGAFGLQCKIRQNMHKSSMNDVIKEFNELKLTDTTSEIDKNVQTGGDCFDSSPWIRATRSYSVNLSGGQTLSEFSLNMKSEGYKVTNEKFYYSKTCGYKYFANAGNGPINIAFVASEYSLTSGCQYSDEYPIKAESAEQYFKPSKIKYTKATLLNQ